MGGAAMSGDLPEGMHPDYAYVWSVAAAAFAPDPLPEPAAIPVDSSPEGKATDDPVSSS